MRPPAPSHAPEIPASGRMRRRAILAGLAVMPAVSRPTLAQRLTTRPVTWVVPFTAGTIADIASRVVAPRMAQALRQPVQVENRPGAGGTIAAEAVARAVPDGQTLLYGGLAAIAAAPHLIPGLRYDPRRDLAPVHGIGASPNFMTVNASRPWTTLPDFVALARAEPSTLAYASPGIGTASHLSAAILQQVANIRLTHLPYANASLALADASSGRVDAIWEAPVTAMPHMHERRLRALAVTGHHRVPFAPGVPTMAECGFPGAEMLAWAGIFVPARTPADQIARLAAALRDALRDPTVQQSFGDTGIELWPDMDEVRFADFLSEEFPRIAALIARLGRTLD